MTKSFSIIRIFGFVAILTAFIIASPHPATAVNHVPDLLGPDRTLNQSQTEPDSLTMRARGAQLNLSELDQVQMDLERGQIPQPLSLSLFPDVRLLAHFERVEHPITGGYSLAGKVGDDPLAEIHLSRIGSTFYASLNTPQGMFRISSQDGQTARIVQIDPTHFMPEQDAVPFLPPSPTLPVVSITTAGASLVDDGSRIDVYVGYTPAAKAAAAAAGQDILNLINTAIAETNTGYANSGVNQRVVLVGTAEYTYNETGLSWITVLNHWSDTTDGNMDAAHTARDLSKADEMVLLIKDPTGTNCGMAWMMGSGSISPSFAPNAFSVVAWNCATGYYSFAHEMGHNMGANHNREAGTGTGAYPAYSYGSWIWIPGTGRYDYRTIMAYNTNGYIDINRSGNKLTYDSTRVNRWASPDAIYAGQPTGAGFSDPYPAYDALTLNNTAPSVAQFRDGAAPTAPTDLTATRLSETSIRLDWTDTSADETRFRIERAPIRDGDWAEIDQVGPDLTTYTDSSILPSADYRYRVLSDNGNGRAASAEVTVPVAPAAPTGLIASGLSVTSIRLDWTDASNNEVRFRIERAAGSDGAWTEIGQVGSNLVTYVDTSLLAAGDYRYRVLADNDYTRTASVETIVPAPPTALLNTIVTPTQIDLTWTDNSMVENGYQVSRSTDNGASWLLLPVTTTNNYPDSTAVCGRLNRYRVWAYTGNATSVYVETGLISRPCAPLFTTTSSTNAIYFNWPELEGVSHYSVEFKSGDVFIAIPGAESLPPTTTRFVWKNLSKNSSYTVRIVAVNSSGVTPSPQTIVKTLLYDFSLPLVIK
jgi:hypothetical protein